MNFPDWEPAADDDLYDANVDITSDDDYDDEEDEYYDEEEDEGGE